jgi:hypothetical protein
MWRLRFILSSNPNVYISIAAGVWVSTYVRIFMALGTNIMTLESTALWFCPDIGSVTDDDPSFPRPLEAEVVTSNIFPSTSKFTTHGNPAVRRPIIYATEKAFLQEADSGSCLQTSCNCRYNRREEKILGSIKITSWMLASQNYAISGHHSNELSRLTTWHERNTCSKSRRSEQSFVSMYRVYSVSIDNILYDVWSVVYYIKEMVWLKICGCYSWELALSIGVDVSFGNM